MTNLIIFLGSGEMLFISFLFPFHQVHVKYLLTTLRDAVIPIAGMGFINQRVKRLDRAQRVMAKNSHLLIFEFSLMYMVVIGFSKNSNISSVD